MKEKITIITPTFNRANNLKELFESLIKQSCKDFRWLIIDDGSCDNTQNIVKNFYNDQFDIKYIYKENGGKHTALNIAFKNLETELAIIVDSDDYLTCDAIERILSDWSKYSNDINICGLCYLKQYKNLKLLNSFPNYETIANYNDYIINNNIKGDKAEVFRTSVLCECHYPEFKDEKFVGEGVMWSKIAHDYEMVFINYPIYICEYLEGGLTKSGRKMRISNPKGGMYHAKEYLSKRYTFKVRFKNSLLFLIYSKFAKIPILKTIKESDNKMILYVSIIPSFIIYYYWKRRYLYND